MYLRTCNYPMRRPLFRSRAVIKCAPLMLRHVWSTRRELVADNCEWAPRAMISGANGGIAVKDQRMWLLGGGFVGAGGGLPDSRRALPRVRLGHIYLYTHSSKSTCLTCFFFLQPGLTEARLHLNDIWSSADGKHWTLHLASAPWKGRHCK